MKGYSIIEYAVVGIMQSQVLHADFQMYLALIYLTLETDRFQGECSSQSEIIRLYND